MYKKIAEYLYKLFVVNSYCAAIQQDDGKYITRYFPLSSFVLEEMLKQKGSMGCYQQGYKNGKIKWICFDFDCQNKAEPDINELYMIAVYPFIKVLDEMSISYLTEFSGRRGIHVWIIFDTILSKNIGYRIVQELNSRITEIANNPSVHIDYFPATDSSLGNKVGKQVKFPLSCHRKGGRSYLFEGKFIECDACFSEEFLNSQLDILAKYTPNKLSEVEDILGISEEDIVYAGYKFKKYELLGNIEVTLKEIENILSETIVYRKIFERMRQGQAMREDWTVLLGTLIYCDNDGTVIKNLFSTFPNYDVKKTLQNIEKLSDRYFPATFSYLYQLYSLEMEEWLDGKETGLVYLLKKIGCESMILEKAVKLNESVNTKESKYTLLKEKAYLLDNDEVPDILIWNRLNGMKEYDLMLLDTKTEAIQNGNWESYVKPVDLLIYDRIESESKTRKMVSLSAEDRVLTTHMTLLLQSGLNKNWHSFSYNISPCSKNQIFYTWHSSWMNYITRVRTFLDVPFLDLYHVFVMDLKGFYDHIDFLAVYRIFEKQLDEKSTNIMQFLIAFNENVMKEMNDGSRCGVPQGPAYARIIAEMFVDCIIQSVLKRYDKSKFWFYRYVDDIVVYYKPEFEGSALYHDLENTLLSFGLPLNQEKSSVLGCIRNLNVREKKLITHSDKFSYDLHADESSLLFEEEQNRKFRDYMMNHDFDISVVSYIFGQNVFPKASEEYYRIYADKIFSEKYGRGSYFKKFYQYLFKNEELLWRSLENGYLFMIPLDSLNFSNFIHCFYLAVQQKEIDEILFRTIQKEFLLKIRTNITNERNANVVEALLLL